MRALISAETARELEKLNSVVRFCDMVRPKIGEDGEQVTTRQGQPVNINTVRAELCEKRADGKQGRQWLAAESGDRADALRKVLDKAKTAPRPATTADELAQQLEEAQNRIAALERERENSGTGGNRSNVTPLRGERSPLDSPVSEDIHQPEQTFNAPEQPTEGGDPGMEAPRKRGRGRPRKNPLPPEDQTQTEPQAS